MRLFRIRKARKKADSTAAPLPPQDRAAIAAAVLRHYREGGEASWTQGKYQVGEAYDLSGGVLTKTGEHFLNQPLDDRDKAMVVVYARLGLDLIDVDTFAKAERAIVGFNDKPSRTFEQVVTLCEKVADRLNAEAAA